MTTKEALAAELGTIPGLDTNILTVALIRQKLTGSELYTPLYDPTVARAAIDVLSTALSGASLTEGGFSYKIDAVAVQRRMEYLIQRYGLVDVQCPGAYIRAIRPW